MMDENLNDAASPSRDDWRFPLLAGLKSWFKNWLFGFAAAALVVFGGLYIFYLYQRPAPVDDVKPAIAVQTPAPIILPTPAKRSSPKQAPQIATEKIANYTINTPATAKIKTEPEPEPLTPAEQDFANRLAIFEGKLP